MVILRTMHIASAQTLQAMQVNGNDPLITMCVSLSGIISATIISQPFMSQCENCPPYVSYQEAAPLILEAKENISPIQSTSVNFTLFFSIYLMSVSLFLTGPLYSFSQTVHTEESHTVRKLLQSSLSCFSYGKEN